MQFYDAHIHYFYEGTVDSVKKEYLSMDGFLGAALLILEKAPSERELLLQMVPGSYHDIVIPGLNFSAAELVQLVNNKKGLSFIPYLDIRFFRSEDLGELKHYVQNGYKGIKILYVPEKDESLKVDGWERSLERTVPESERFVADIVAESERLGLPVLFHVDLNRYNEYACELFSSFPNVFFDIPHFGSSRKKMAEVLSRYPNCYTDFSSLLPFIKKAPEAYQDFIRTFSDRVLFGSDAILGHPMWVKEYADYMKTFLEGDLLEKVACGNFRRFHRLGGS